MEQMERKEVRMPVQTSIPGNDKGSMVFFTLILVITLSFVFFSIVSRVSALEKYTYQYKEKVISDINAANEEIMKRYGLD